MRTSSIIISAFIIFQISVHPFTLKSQDFPTALSYMEHIGTNYKEIRKNQWDYTNSIAKNKGARKIEKRRMELLKSNSSMQKELSKMPPFKSNSSLRDSVISYLQTSYSIINNDYEKIVDMEEIAEQSYNDMEAYLLAREKASEKLNLAGEIYSNQLKIFALNNNINLTGSQDKISKKMKIANKMYKYYNVVYLIFFKTSIQESYLVDALKRKDINSIEQNKNFIISFSQEGIKALSRSRSYNGDPSLANACKKALAFYKDESENHISIMLNYYLAQEKFDKIKTAFDNKRQSDRTQEDIDNFNNAVNEVNEAVNKSNETNNMLNIKRSEIVNEWNKISSKFTEKHISGK